MKDIKKILSSYKDTGITIFPVQEDKSPVKGFIWNKDIAMPTDFKDAHGVGVVCGKASGGLEVIDIDNHFGDAKSLMTEFMNLKEVKDVFSRNNIVVNSTNGGGYHIIYRANNINGNKKLSSRPKWSDKEEKFKPDAIFETRGDGGYIVAPPTKGYESVRGHILKVCKISDQDRDTLIEAAKSFNQWIPEERKEAIGTKERVGDKFDNDSSSVYEAQAALKKAGWSDLGNGRWRRPEKSKGISATFGKVAPNVFYCFTSNGYPFEEMSAYSPFQVVALLDYGGDFSAFAKDLAERYDPKEPKESPVTNREKKEVDASKMDGLLSRAFIDISIPVPRPPAAMEIRWDEGRDWQRFLTLGNISVITGKAKAKKTFFTSMVNAAAAGGHSIYNRFRGVLPEGKGLVIRIDTEQSDYDAYTVAKRVEDMIPENLRGEHYASFDLREYNPEERIEMVDYIFNKFGKNIGMMIIDGIADLAKTFNDEVEASKLVSLLLKWSKIYNCHIMNIIHQNKGDNFATGHLGSALMKKSEMVISVSKEENNPEVSIVENENARGVKEFKSFNFNINENGMPVILGIHGVNTDFSEIFN